MYSFNNQPARTAILTLRKQLEMMGNEDNQPKKVSTGLLSPKAKPMSDATQNKSEARRVLDYMKEIRNTMGAYKNGV